jgi:hypothetical protein
VLDALVIADVDFMEDDGYTILDRDLGDSLVSMLFEDVRDDKALEAHVAKGVGEAVAQNEQVPTHSCSPSPNGRDPRLLR